MNKRIISSIFIFILISTLFGCADDSQGTATTAPSDDSIPVAIEVPQDVPKAEPVVANEDTDEVIIEEPEPELIMFEIPHPEASGTHVLENDRVLVDYSNSGDGYFMVKFLEETNRDLRMRLTLPTGGNHVYIQRSDGEFAIYPFSHGNGTYQIEVFVAAGNGAFTHALNETIKVELIDEFTPFIRPSYYVAYNENNEAIKFTWELTKSLPEEMQKIAAVYDYVIHNISYDMDFAKSVQGGSQTMYIPDIDAIKKRGTGICFDYAALMTAMLRSQGIPTQLVFGFVGKVYHAWINVYTEEAGWLDAVIYFNGSEWVLMDPTFASSMLDDSGSLEQFVGDGNNYDVRFIF